MKKRMAAIIAVTSLVSSQIAFCSNPTAPRVQPQHVITSGTVSFKPYNSISLLSGLFNLARGILEQSRGQKFKIANQEISVDSLHATMKKYLSEENVRSLASSVREKAEEYRKVVSAQLNSLGASKDLFDVKSPSDVEEIASKLRENEESIKVATGFVATAIDYISEQINTYRVYLDALSSLSSGQSTSNISMLLKKVWTTFVASFSSTLTEDGSLALKNGYMIVEKLYSADESKRKAFVRSLITSRSVTPAGLTLLGSLIASTKEVYDIATGLTEGILMLALAEAKASKLV